MQALKFESVPQLAAELQPFNLPPPVAVAGTEVARRPLGMDRGRFKVPEDFDAPLPDEVQALFEEEKPKRVRRAGKRNRRRRA
jgi:hypothetical protein